MPDRLTLISHAATAATRSAAFPADEPLDAGGRSAALAARDELRADRFLSSPARRCVETATALGLTVTVDQRLRDAAAGYWAGRTMEDVAATDADAVGAWLAGAAPPGGESWEAVRARVRGMLDEGGTTVAVTHAAVIRALVVEVLRTPAEVSRRIEVAPLTRTVLVGGPGRWALRMLGAPM